jgi:hypothetical protein
MPVSAFTTGDRFIVRVTKYLNTNPDNKWVNSYEFRAIASGGESDLLGLGEALVDFEAQFHHTAVIFDRILISTWEPDSVPYDPAVFIASTLTAVGINTSGGELEALDKCLSVARVAATGRFGHLFYRGALTEADVVAPAGKSIIGDRAAMQTIIEGAISTAGLDAYIGQDATTLQMVLINADGDQVRPVIQLIVQGVSTVKPDHKWFNRTTTTVP